MTITVICLMLLFVFIILLIKTRYKGSALGKRAATILYVMGAGFYLGVFAYSVSEDIKEMFVSSHKTEEQLLPINRAENVGTVYGEAKNEVKLKFVEAKILEPIEVKILSSVQSEAESSSQNNVNGNNNKGKIIGDKDSNIYHVPGSKYYERELKKLNNNEYFKTVEEAETAGYRAPKN